MPIKVNQKNISKRVEIVRAWESERKLKNSLVIKAADLVKMKKNFDGNVQRQKLQGSPVLPFDYSHNVGGEAAGWITSLEVGRDSTGIDALFGEVEWTEKAAAKIRANEFKFTSAWLHFNFVDSETGKIHDIVLKGAALTNVPFIRDMEAVRLLSEGGTQAYLSLELSGDTSDPKFQSGQNMTLDELKKAFAAMSPEEKEKFLSEQATDEQKKLPEELAKAKADLEKSQADLRLSEEKNKEPDSEGSDALKLAETEIIDLKKSVGALMKEKAQDKKTSEFNAMLSGGKTCEAQRDPFMSGDMLDFAKKQQETKLDESGNGSRGDESNSADKASDELEKLAEEKAKSDKIPYDVALSEVVHDNKTLAAKAGY